MTAIIDDTYAEAFRSLYTEFLITARDKKWLDHAIHAATGNASSTILCDCEAGLDRYVGPGTAEFGGDESVETPDGRPGALIQLHVPRFWKDRVKKLEKAALVRISQNVLTCPTTRCFNACESENYFKMGRKVSFFGNGYQKRVERFDRKMWWIPILGGEFLIERRLGYENGLMGGNLWFFGNDESSALSAAESAADAVQGMPGVVMTFPGGIAASGSKAGSKYKFSIASTYEKFCPLLRDQVETGLPDGVESVMEIIINGRDMDSIVAATQKAINASKETDGLAMISAGNYDGKLGKSFIYLHPEKQPAK